DVDDPLFAKARELGVHYLDLAAREEARLNDDLAALELVPMYSTPRASSAIADIRGFIGMVLERGFAYQSGGAVYFDVARSREFGSVSHYDREVMLALARERGGNVDDPQKRDPLDFVLWQPSAADEPSWDTIWGAGRPGWHIECSALALRELGTTIDLHGGGTDLIYPHHECERAQSEAATGQPFVRHWMHVASEVVVQSRFFTCCQIEIVHAEFACLGKERIIHVGHVAHTLDTAASVDQSTNEDVIRHECECMTEMRRVIRRHATDIHFHLGTR
ncbi:MAG: hypothetical protein EB104_03045, partial [Acidimicrobiia bacterium]|nr:hypothetical protein [Acidimicrobiia bacterium]